MIPVLIAPVVNRWDLAEKMLASIDVPVGRRVIVDNGSGNVPEDVPDVIWTVTNVGYSGAMNLAISQTFDAPWWLWVSNDVTFAPGDLAHICELMKVPGPRVVTGDRNDARSLRFAYAAANRECIDLVGLLDEWSFFPLYFEDDDYERRCHLGGVEWVEYNGQIAHERSSTIHSDPVLATRNQMTFRENANRYVDKWGGMPGEETFDTPWNSGMPLWVTRPDIAGRALRQW